MPNEYAAASESPMPENMPTPDRDYASFRNLEEDIGYMGERLATEAGRLSSIVYNLYGVQLYRVYESVEKDSIESSGFFNKMQEALSACGHYQSIIDTCIAHMETK